MPQTPYNRDNQLKRFQALLSSEDGQELIKELSQNWDAFNLLGDNPQDTGYNCGLRDAFVFLRELQSGEHIGKLDD